MEQILYIPGRGRGSNTLHHIATKCGHCDDNNGGTGGGNGNGSGNGSGSDEERRIGYLIRPERRSRR